MKNLELIDAMAQRRTMSRSRLSQQTIAPYSRSISNKRSKRATKYFKSTNTTVDMSRKKMFGGLGRTHRPGFSFISKSMPRNNHNFVKGGAKVPVQ